MPQKFNRTMAGRQHEVSNCISLEWSVIFSAHFLHTGRRATSRKSQSDSSGWLMPDQSAGVMSSSLQSAALGNKDR